MAEPGVLQLYCTHCTYGTSALHRNEGAIRDQVFEYSLRAGSVEQQRSHDLFRQIEPCLYFRLPPDTPAAEVRGMTADTCPWQRLTFYPSISGYEMLARVCYRQTDTRGRPGSYFAHVLLARPEDSRIRWSAADCLKLWGAPFWISADSDTHPYELQKLSDLRELEGFGAFVNDDVLLSFLTTPANGQFVDDPADSPNCVIPSRWRAASIQDRQQLLTDVLQGLLELDWDRQERLVIAVEPSVAALLFFGVARCLPQKGLAEKLSFSTYESHTDRPAAVLVACTFYRPGIEDLLPEIYRSKGFVRNTYRNHPPRPFRKPEARYAEWIIFQLIHDGSRAVDAIVQDLEAAEASGPAEWEQAVVRHDECRAAVSAHDPADFGKSSLSPVERVYAGRVLARLLETAEPERIRRLAASPAYLPILDLVGAQPAFPPAKTVTIALLEALPRNDGIRNRFLRLPGLASAFKGIWLANFFKKHERLPVQLVALWEPDGLKTGGPLAQAIHRLDAGQAGMAAVSVPAEFLPRFVELVAESAARDPAKGGALAELLKRLEADAVGTLLAAHHEIMQRFFPPPQPQLSTRLEQLLQKVLKDAKMFPKRLSALIAGSVYLPRTAATRIQLLVDFRDAMKAAVNVPEPKKGIFGTKDGPELEAALDRLLDVMKRLFDDFPMPPATAATMQLLQEAMTFLDGSRRPMAWQTVGRSLLVRQVHRMNDSQLLTLLSGDAAADWLKQYPPESPVLADRLRKILGELASNPSELDARVPVLMSAVSHQLLPESRPLVEAWSSVVRLLAKLRDLRCRQPAKFENLVVVPKEVGELLLKLAAALGQALDGQVWFNRKKDVIENQHIIYQIGQGYFGDSFLEEVKVFPMQLRHHLPRK